jgi:hypothetical protein
VWVVVDSGVQWVLRQLVHFEILKLASAGAHNLVPGFKSAFSMGARETTMPWSPLRRWIDFDLSSQARTVSKFQSPKSSVCD